VVSYAIFIVNQIEGCFPSVDHDWETDGAEIGPCILTANAWRGLSDHRVA